MPDSTPLYHAALQGDADEVSRLLAAGADPDEQSHGSGDGTPLCAAALWGLDDVVRALLDGGAQPDLAEDDGEGLTPLLWAAGNGHVVTALWLLEAGADANREAQGWTPLHRAITRGSLGMVQLLLQHGADPKVTDEDGRDALAAARSWDGIDVEAELRERVEHGAGGGGETTVERELRPDGTEQITVNVGNAFASAETGHAAIAALLAADVAEG